MTAKNRPELIGKLHTELKKHFKPAPPSPGRPLMEHVLYASLLEDTPADLADEGFAKCEQEFFDWNEVRVTTVTELAEVLSRLPSATAAALRLKKNLQSIFETFYNFDIDYLKKENLGKAVAKFEAMPGISPFVLSYLVQHGLGGHAIPVDSSSMKIMWLTGIVSESEVASGKVPGLERTIPKNRALEFSSLLHQAGMAFNANTKDKAVWEVLLAVNNEAKMLFDRPKAASKSAKKPTPAIDPATQPSAASSASSTGKSSKATAAKPGSADKKSTKTPTAPSAKPLDTPKPIEKGKGSAAKPVPTKSTPSGVSPVKTPIGKAPASKTPAGTSTPGKGDKLASKIPDAKPLSTKSAPTKSGSTKAEATTKADDSKPATKSPPKSKSVPASKPASEKKPSAKATVEPTKKLSAKTPTAEKSPAAKSTPAKPAATKPSSKKTDEKPLSKKPADTKLTPAKKGVTSTNKKLTKQKPR
jgi:endonuclease III